jgi:predicted regulator of Ras-like GTPase activity (Roadblock/LC7/MglB family)
MTADLPEGTSLGTMQAPLSWIYSHTVRFLGAVKVAVRDGRGFVLIRRGEAVAYFFRYGDITLRGNAAREYLSSIEVLELTLCKHTDEEFASAVAWCREEGVPVHDEGGEDTASDPSGGEAAGATVPSSLLAEEDGVRLVARCTDEDMTVLAGSCPEGLACVDIAASFWESESLIGALHAGTLSYFILETHAGRFCAVPDGDGILCVLTDPAIRLGRVRALVQGLLSEQ